jgi:hypothetical protein
VSEVLRSLVEQGLETMEGGRFQDFSLEFLPLYDARFQGLSRLGHTAGGKTRAGTPDLLKTDASGQTGVQCGTDEDYWPSEDSVEGSKPYEDALKCIRVLERPVEIVLVTNRETPARTPNIKLMIATALQRDSDARISLLGREDLSQFLITHLETERVRRLVAKFFPTASAALEARAHADRLRVLSAVAETRSVDIRTVLPIVDEAFTVTPEMRAATDYVLDRLDELSRCRLPALPTFGGVIRPSVAELPMASPHGKVWVVTGVPKVGKTNVIVQLATTWREGSAVWWFDCPLSDSEECAEEIAADLVRLALPRVAPASLIRSQARLEAALTATRPMCSPTVIVVDNADRLPAAGLHRLGEILKLMRRHGALAQVACVFIAARRLGPLRAAVDETLTAPAWTPRELGLLLDHLGVTWEGEHREQYLDLLSTRSGGHPLLALVLARRHPDFSGLFLSVLNGVPSLGDEDLSREAQQLLYEDLLTDADSQNFVQRLSILLERTPTDVLEVLRTEVAPVIATSTSVLLDRLSPSVVEGSSENGFQVAFVFREIAKQMLSPAEQQVVYRAAADLLLTPQGRTVVADRTCTGIFYGVLAHDVHRSMFWTTTLLKRAVDQGLPNDVVAGLLSRLAFMPALRPPADLPGRFSHAVMLLAISHAHVHVGQREKAAEVLSQVNAEDPGGTDAQELRDGLPQLRLVVALGRVVNLLMANRDGALTAIESLGSSEYATIPSKQWPIVLDMLGIIISREGISERTPKTLRAAIEQIDVVDAGCRTAALRVAGAVGFAVSRAQADANGLKNFFSENAFGGLLEQFARGVLSIERGDGQDARRRLEVAVAIARAQGWTRGLFWSDLQGYVGDAARLTGDDTAAVAAYKESRATGSASSFMSTWSSWRLGLVREDIGALDDAATGFRTQELTGMWARAVGARGALLLASGQDLAGLQCFASILEAYYGLQDMTVGPAVTVACAQLQRYSAQRAGRPIADEDSVFPALGPMPYDFVVATAMPRAGPLAAYFLLGEALKGIGSEAEARRFLALAADAVPENETDRIALPLVLSTLIGALGASESDRAETRRRFQQFVTTPREGASDVVFARLLFAQDEGGFALTDGGLRLEALVTCLDQGLADAQVASDFWRAEILAGRARLDQARGAERGRIVRLWGEAMAKAIASQNWRILLQAGQAIGFEFPEYAGSLRQLAQHQFQCLRGAELGGVAFEFLGVNLFRIWAQLKYRHLSERDLETKCMLMDSANEMERLGSPPMIARPAMVLLLARLHRHEGPATDWARQQLAGHRENIPDAVRERLDEKPGA